MHGLMMHTPLLISSILEHAVAAAPDQEIVSVERDGSRRRMCYREFGEYCAQTAHFLQTLGVAQDSRVATLAWNTHRHLALYYSVPGIGAIVHTLNPRLGVDTIAHIINEAEDTVLAFDEDFIELAGALKPLCPTLRHFVLLGSAGGSADNGTVATHFLDDELSDQPSAFTWRELDERQASGLCYTSGTTGQPKGVLYSHRSTVLHALTCALPAYLDVRESDTVAVVVPMFHVNAWGLPYLGLLAGSRLVLPRNALDGANLAGLFDDESVTVSVGVPTLWLGLMAHMQSTQSRLPSLRRLMLGGAAMPRRLVEWFEHEHGIEMIQGWGMTETSPVCTIGTLTPALAAQSREARTRIKLMQGRPLFGIRLRIADETDGMATPGELLVRGGWVTSGYFGHDCAPRSDGWFPTGDIAHLTDEGYVQLTDRAKDLIKSGGEWISSVALEELAMQVEGVAMAAAVGVPDERWGERPILVVAGSGARRADNAAILEHIAQHVPSWQVPDRIEHVEHMPMGATGKILKSELRARYGGT